VNCSWCWSNSFTGDKFATVKSALTVTLNHKLEVSNIPILVCTWDKLMYWFKWNIYALIKIFLETVNNMHEWTLVINEKLKWIV
jgi:hypothetical protein